MIMMNALTLFMMMVLIFNMFFVIKITLDYMMLPNLVHLIWFIVAFFVSFFTALNI